MIQYEDGRWYWLLHPGQLLIEPLKHDGFTPMGIEVTHHERLPRVFGLVLACHSSIAQTHPDITPGSIVHFRQHSYDECDTSTGVRLYVLKATKVWAIVDTDSSILDNEYISRDPKPSSFLLGV